MNYIRKIAFVIMGVITALLATPVIAFAVGDAAVPVTTDSNSLAQIKISPTAVTMIVSLLIPLLHGFITKLSDSQGIKVSLMIILNAVNTLLVGAIMVDGAYVFTKETFLTFVVTTAVSLASQSHIYKKVGLTSDAIALPDPNNPGHQLNVPGKLAGVGRQ